MRKTILLLALCGASVVLGACGGGDDEAQPAAQAPNPPSTSNQAPTITGAPLTSVMQGTQYSFTPTASDADQDVLTFSIVNKPSWATFTTANGRLEGTPGPSDVGMYADIRISVTDGAATANLPPFGIVVVATATGSATLSWNAPTQNTDGSPLTNLAGYKVYWGTSQNNLNNSAPVGANVTSHLIEPLTPATWYFAMTSVNSQGLESAFSNVASKTVQ